MARPTTLRFGAGAIYFEETAAPGTFTKICGFTEITFSVDKDLNDTVVEDCADPDAPAWIERDVVSQSAPFSASGVLAKEAWPLVKSALLTTTARKVRIIVAGLGEGGATPNERIEGNFHVTAEVSGERGSRFNIAITGESDGEVTFTAVAA
jgi:hypothetical protein